MKLCYMTGHRVGMITYVQFFGVPAPRKFRRAKKLKIWLDFGQFFTLIVNILRTDHDIKKN